jgi:hypothetical protein
MADERVELLERPGVQQLVDPLAGGQLALGVLLLLRLRIGVDRLLAELLELRELGSSSFSIRSRAVSLPFACCFSTASAEAEWIACSRRSRR